MATLWKMSADDFLSKFESKSKTTSSYMAPPEERRHESGGIDIDPFAVLSNLPLLADDVRFIHHQTRFLSHSRQRSVLVWYRRIFLKGKERDRQDNGGRRRANAFLRRYVRRIPRPHTL